MKEFKIEKEELIGRLKEEMTNHDHRENRILESLYEYLKSINSAKQLNGFLSRKVVDHLDYRIEIGSNLIEFEKYFSNPVNSVISPDLKRLTNYLIKNKIEIKYWGKAWSENQSDWIYFDKVLDLEKLRTKLNFGESIIDHQNLDSRSGLEKGFIDRKTGEGVMGKVN